MSEMTDAFKKLNKRERYKAKLRPIDFFKEFETLDFENLGEGDRYYLQDFGIYNADFAEEDFTLRLRLPSGRILATQAQAIAHILKKYDLSLILTARSGMQISGLEADNILEVWKAVNEIGLSTWQSFGDNVRNIVCDVYDERGRFAQIESASIAQAMHNYIVQNPPYVGMLPRRLSVGISGNSANVTSMYANDLYFGLARKDGDYGFNVYLGGKNTEVARCADIFLTKEKVLPFFIAFIETFNTYGSRGSRSRTRLFYLLEEIGLEGFKTRLQEQYKEEFSSKGERLIEEAHFEINETLNDGSFAHCYESDFGRISALELEEISTLALKEEAEIRIGIDQNIYLLGLSKIEISLKSPKISNTIMACAGSQYCPFSFWNIKDETQYLPLEKIRTHQIQVGFSGCAKGCGRHRHSDIGLIGLKTNNFGATEGGARVYIGAEHSNGNSVARQLFEMVPLVFLHESVSLIIEVFEKSEFRRFETFSEKVLSVFSVEFLSLWFLLNLQSKQSLKLLPDEALPSAPSSFQAEVSLLERYFPQASLFPLKEEKFSPAITALSQELWFIKGEDPHYKPPISRTFARGSI